MKEVLKVAKMFACGCGALNKFEFETDFNLEEMKLFVKCQNCGSMRELSIADFLKPSGIAGIRAAEESKMEKEEEKLSFEEEGAYADLFGRV